MSYEFSGSLYRDRHQMLEAIVEDWITGGGQNSPDTIREMRGDKSIRDFADECYDECIKMWELDDEWLAERDCTQADLRDAFRSWLKERENEESLYHRVTMKSGAKFTMRADFSQSSSSISAAFRDPKDADSYQLTPFQVGDASHNFWRAAKMVWDYFASDEDERDDTVETVE
jgi:hypothetical protein